MQAVYVRDGSTLMEGVAEMVKFSSPEDFLKHEFSLDEITCIYTVLSDNASLDWLRLVIKEHTGKWAYSEVLDHLAELVARLAYQQFPQSDLATEAYKTSLRHADLRDEAPANAMTEYQPPKEKKRRKSPVHPIEDEVMNKVKSMSLERLIEWARELQVSKDRIARYEQMYKSNPGMARMQLTNGIKKSLIKASKEQK